jgi:glycosyltransferase involved in cell wall biosynthesis
MNYIKPKPKLLIWSDAPCVPTGFGNVAKNLFSELYKDFDVDIVGINYNGIQKYDHTKYHIYPVQQTAPLGDNVLRSVVMQEKFDIIFMFQDIFHISQILPQLKQKFPTYKYMTYFPIDGGPLFADWRNVFELSDKAITYTQFAKNMIVDSYPSVDVSKVDYLYHGVEPVFKPLSRQEKKRVKAELKWVNKFVAVNVNRYQPRKNVSATVRAWALFSNGYKLCECGNAYPKHLDYCDANRCDHTKVVKETEGHEDVVLYLHMRPYEKVNGPGAGNTLQALLQQAGFSDKDIRSGKVMVQERDIYAQPYTVEQMNQVYNAADINISTAIGEGVGLSLIESAGSGTTSIAPRNSAIIEMLDGHGVLVDNVPNGMYTQPLDNSFKRPNVDTLKFAQAIEEQYQLWVANNRKKIVNQAAMDAVKTKFDWADKRDYIRDQLLALLK